MNKNLRNKDSGDSIGDDHNKIYDIKQVLLILCQNYAVQGDTCAA